MFTITRMYEPLMISKGEILYADRNVQTMDLEILCVDLEFDSQKGLMFKAL